MMAVLALLLAPALAAAVRGDMTPIQTVET